MYLQVKFREDFLPDPYSPNLVFEVNIASAENGAQNKQFSGQHGVLDPRQASRQTQTKVIKFHSGNMPKSKKDKLKEKYPSRRQSLLSLSMI